MAARPGFIVLNAPDVGSNLDIAEPDAQDFNLLGNQRFGVLQGCEVTVTGSSWTVNVAQGVYVVNGQVVAGGGQVPLPTSSQSPRFDLIIGDTAGHISAIMGPPSENPVFPTYDDKVTVFASVLIQPGATPPLQDQVTDKRVMVMERFVSAILNGGPLLSNQDPVSLASLFKIDPDGKMWWQDTTLGRTSAKTLRLDEHLVAIGDVDAKNLNATVDVRAGGDVVADNFRQGSVNPTGTASLGDLYKNLTTGTVWVYQAAGWKQLSTDAIPAGMTMTGFMTTPPFGWLPVTGQTISKEDSGGLWDLFPTWRRNAMELRLPDARDCFYAWGAPAVRGGNATGQVTISINNMPNHKHLVSPTTDAGGSHVHPVSMTPTGRHNHQTNGDDGQHTHQMTDPGHMHPPPFGEGHAFGGYILTDWVGMNRVDGPFNDSSHTYAVEEHPDTGLALTGVAASNLLSQHYHSTNYTSDHVHTITLGSGGDTHSHPIRENTVGGGAALDIRPPFLGMWLFIKT